MTPEEQLAFLQSQYEERMKREEEEQANRSRFIVDEMIEILHKQILDGQIPDYQLATTIAEQHADQKFNMSSKTIFSKINDRINSKIQNTLPSEEKEAYKKGQVKALKAVIDILIETTDQQTIADKLLNYIESEV